MKTISSRSNGFVYAPRGCRGIEGMDRSSPEALARAVTVRKRELRLNFILRSIKVGNIVWFPSGGVFG